MLECPILVNCFSSPINNILVPVSIALNKLNINPFDTIETSSITNISVFNGLVASYIKNPPEKPNALWIVLASLLVDSANTPLALPLKATKVGKNGSYNLSIIFNIIFNVKVLPTPPPPVNRDML